VTPRSPRASGGRVCRRRPRPTRPGRWRPAPDGGPGSPSSGRWRPTPGPSSCISRRPSSRTASAIPTGPPSPRARRAPPQALEPGQRGAGQAGVMALGRAGRGRHGGSPAARIRLRRDRPGADAGDLFRHMSGPAPWALSLGLGPAGALVGHVIFTLGLGPATPTSSTGAACSGPSSAPSSCWDWPAISAAVSPIRPARRRGAAAYRVRSPAGSGPCSYAPLPPTASANNPSYC
jgi:hypothetical protein